MVSFSKEVSKKVSNYCSKIKLFIQPYKLAVELDNKVTGL